MIEKFTFDIQAPAFGFLSKTRDEDSRRLPSDKMFKKKMILVKGDFEHRTHIVLKLLAYILYYDPRLQIEMSVDMHYKPDLVVPGDHGVPEVWIDCGQVAPKKVETLAHKLKSTRLCLVKETKREMEQFRKLIEKKVDYPERLEYLSFEKGFVLGIAEALQKTNEVTLYQVMENVIGFALNQEVFESALYL